MDDVDQTTGRPKPVRPRSRSRFWLWTALLTFCTALGLGKPVYDLHWRNKQVLFTQAAANEQVTRRDVGTEIWQRLFWANGEPPESIEKILGLEDGELARSVPAAGRQEIAVDGARLGINRGSVRGAFRPATRPVVPNVPNHPDATGWRLTLKFRDGVFAGAIAAPPPALLPPRPAVRDALRMLARGTLFAGVLVWLGGLLAGATERGRHGSRFAETAFAGALAATVAWLVRGDVFTTTPNAIGLGVGAAMMLVALRAVRWLRRIEWSRRFHFCYDCGYDLTGNVSGVCPECGADTYDGQLRRRAAGVAAAAASVAQTTDDTSAGVEHVDAERCEDGYPDDVVVDIPLSRLQR